VYLIACRGRRIYTGIARDVAARYAQHVAGTGARFTRAHPPRRLLGRFACPNQSEASRLEAAIKKLDPAAKRALLGKSGAAARQALL
jgi:putative endonuclease